LERTKRAVKTQNVVVVGLGEVGRPLLELASQHHNAIGVDISPSTRKVDRVDVLHVCYPFQIADFVGETARYINMFRPGVTVINSTVAVGTTRRVAERAGVPVVNSPVRGKHARMLQELSEYTKFLGSMESESARVAAEHFESLGLKTKILGSPEATELAKLTETTYFGLMIAWAQELERYCDHAEVKYEEITSFYEEIKFFPSVKYFPGVIGGHCVIPNIEILTLLGRSVILDAIQVSNRMKTEREARKGLVVASDAETVAVLT
jgi:UDP-N-acetyl-D-mannosaminuronate dehydrogenase